MIVKAAKRHTYEIIHQNHVLGKIRFPGLWSMKLVGVVNDEDIEISTKDFWKNRYQVSVDGELRGTLKLSWFWEVDIMLNDPVTEQVKTFVLRRRGLFNTRYVMTDAIGKELFTLRPKFKLSKIGYDYEIENRRLGDDGELAELLIYAMFIAKLHLRRRRK